MPKLGLTEYGWDCLMNNIEAIAYAESIRYEATKHILSQSDVKSASFWIDQEDYFTLQAMFGHAFVIGLLRFYEAAENYERCGKIKFGIEYMNQIAKTTFSTTNYDTSD